MALVLVSMAIEVVLAVLVAAALATWARHSARRRELEDELDRILGRRPAPRHSGVPDGRARCRDGPDQW